MKLLEAEVLGRGVIAFIGPHHRWDPLFRFSSVLLREHCFCKRHRGAPATTGAMGGIGRLGATVCWHPVKLGPPYVLVRAGALVFNVYRLADARRPGVAWNRIGSSGVIGVALSVRRVCAVLNWRRV